MRKWMEKEGRIAIQQEIKEETVEAWGRMREPRTQRERKKDTQ